MKVLHKLLKRVEIIVFAIGFVAGIYVFVFYPAKYFLVWHALPSPPEPVTKLYSVDHMSNILIDTVTDNKYECNLNNESDCWTEVNYEPIAFGTVLCFRNCHDRNVKQVIKATGQNHSFGEVSFIYELRDDGVIYVRHMGFLYLPGYMLGTFIGALSAFIAYIFKRLLFRVTSLSLSG